MDSSDALKRTEGQEGKNPVADQNETAAPPSTAMTKAPPPPTKQPVANSAAAAAQRKAPRPPPSSVSSSWCNLDRLVVLFCAVLVAAMLVTIPLSYLARQVGVPTDVIAVGLTRIALRSVAQSRVGARWPLSRLLQPYREMRAKDIGIPEAPRGPPKLKDDDGTPLDMFSGLRSTDILAEDEEYLMAYVDNPTYARFEDSALFFRPLPRRVPVAPETNKPTMRFVYQYREPGSELKPEGEAVMATAVAKGRLRHVRYLERRWFEKREDVTGVTNAKRPMVSSYGMADIDPQTNLLRTRDAPDTEPSPGADPYPITALDAIPCVHPYSSIGLDLKVAMIGDGFVLENTYLNHAEDPLNVYSHSLQAMRPCLQRVLPMMCVGDRWEVICPRNLTRRREVAPFRSLIIHVDLRDVTQAVASLDDAGRALAESVFMTEEEVHANGGKAGFTRAMLLERAKKGPPLRQMGGEPVPRAGGKKT